MGCGHPSSWSGANRKAIRGLPRGGQLESAHHDKRMAKIARHARGSKFKLRQNPLYRPQQWTGRAPSPLSHMHLWRSRGPAPGRTRAGFSCVGHLFSCQAFAVIFSPAISRYGVAPSNRCLAEKPRTTARTRPKASLGPHKQRAKSRSKRRNLSPFSAAYRSPRSGYERQKA
jgi:hypothetical protein